MNIESKLCISVSEAAALLGLSRPIMYDLCHAESCTFVIRVGRRMLVSRVALEAWVEKNTLNMTAGR